MKHSVKHRCTPRHGAHVPTLRIWALVLLTLVRAVGHAPCVELSAERAKQRRAGMAKGVAKNVAKSAPAIPKGAPRLPAIPKPPLGMFPRHGVRPASCTCCRARGRRGKGGIARRA